MRAGYLCLYTVADRPGVVRLVDREQAPPGLPAPDDPQLRYVARFKDLDAGLMHLQTALRRGLVDLNRRLYRTELVRAVAALEAEELSHERVWIDPTVSAEAQKRIAALKAVYDRRHRLANRAWQVAGGLGIALLLFRALGLF
ncbi:MAG: hypothetical protein R3202_10610 [Candidatus Competibacterales bacterium]|nr:hypothetical protein [Candidatus Competibacterales bacterium]